jgi:hypothetical protein
MNAPRIRIVDNGSGKHVAMNTHVYVITEDDEGNEQELEISQLVRGVDIDIKVGDALTAKLDVFVSGIETRAQVEEILATYLSRRSWWKRLRRRRTDITTFSPTGVREVYD